MRLDRLRRQDGVIREAVKYFAIVVIMMVMILDAVAVIQAQIAVRDNASVAASDAKVAYVDGQTTAQVKAGASSYLEAKGSDYISATISETPSRQDAVVTVVAERHADTFLYRHFARLPWGLGDRIDNLLNPTVSRSSE